MNDEHLTTVGLAGLVTLGPSSPEVGYASAHLALCSSCRGLLARLPEGTASAVRQMLVAGTSGKRYSVFDYRRAVSRVVERLKKKSADFCREEEQAHVLLEELERYPVAQRRMVVGNLERFRSWGLASLLLEQSRKQWTGDPAQAEANSVMACDIAEGLEAEGYQELLLNDLRAEAWSFVANASRIRGHLDKALRAFEKAESWLTRGSGDSSEEAQLLDLKVSLLRDLGRFNEAFEVLDHVIRCRRRSGDLHLVGRGLISKALLLEKSQRYSEALQLLAEAEGLVDCSREPLLELHRRVNLINNLLELKRPTEARSLLHGVKHLAKLHGNRLDRLRSRWVEAQVLCAVGQRDLGKAVFRSVHDSLLLAGAPHEAAAAALDLAAVLLEEGRVHEFQEMIGEVCSYALAVCTDIEREALELLVGFGQPEQNVVPLRALLGQASRLLRVAPRRLSDLGPS